ncbi:MAG: anthranilate phosphoribosyltransferase [Flavobacteriaceae bacterium]|tara:strand:+ start:975 stop:1970 length:996 start_codon:yes stop_codon:yes gene_type:complete
MKKILEKLFNHSYLSYEESKKILKEISSNKYNYYQVASFLTIFKMRNPSVQEIEGFRDALLDLCIKIDLSSDFETIDLCGTGGDGKNTFNISTISSFVVAGAGYKVTKHGNYGVSSNCGSSDVLKYLGVRLSNNQDYLKKCLDKGSFCYLHAPLFHPAMKNVASVRKELKFKTFFNILGPLVNPSRPKNQLCGVYNLEIARLYGYVFENTNKNYSILHSLDGYDEISLTNDFKLLSRNKSAINSPNYFGFNKINPKEIEGGIEIKDSVDIFIKILENKATKSQTNVVLANSAIAIQTITDKEIDECLSIAKESIESGNALNSLKKIQILSL